jgi:thioredoxin reductase (NADPH)
MQSKRATLYGLPNSPEAYLLRDFLTRSGFPFEWIELKTDEDAKNLAGVSGRDDPRLPVCVLEHGSVLYRPTIHDLASAFDWFQRPKYDFYDLAIYGAGPAGLSAAVYGASEGLRTIVIERSAVGGQAGSTSHIENYLGFPDGISGWELASRARQQAQRLGAEIIVTAEGVGGDSIDGWAIGRLSDGHEIVSRAAICSTGVQYARLDLPDEDKYLGRGLFYGAGASEASRCKGHVFIVGGGNSAGQAAINFSQFADKITMLVRGECLKATLSTYLVQEIEAHRKIDVLLNTTLSALEGSGQLEFITFRDNLRGVETRAATNWTFICIGGSPHTDWAEPGTLLTDSAGYILTGEDLHGHPLPAELWSGTSRKPMFMESSLPGRFAAGDVRHNSIKRCATAVGEGATAVSMVHQFLGLNGQRSAEPPRRKIL